MLLVHVHDCMFVIRGFVSIFQMVQLDIFSISSLRPDKINIDQTLQLDNYNIFYFGKIK